MSEPTPGPWQFLAPTKGRTFAVVGIIDSDRSIRIANVGDRQLDADEMNANAALIAAAPDLLAVARALVKWADESEDDGVSPCCICGKPSKDEGPDCPVVAARAAIAKAEGRAS